MNNPYLFPALIQSCLVVQRLAEAVPPAKYDERVDPERFSFREAIAHLNDWEEIDLERFRAGVEASGSRVVDIDESERAIAKSYEKLDPIEQARQLLQRRTAAVEYMKRHFPGNETNFVVHPVRGKQTLEDLLSMLLAHDVYHIEHLVSYLP